MKQSRGAPILISILISHNSGIKTHSFPQDYELTLLQSIAYTCAFESETAVVMVNAGGPITVGYNRGSGV